MSKRLIMVLALALVFGVTCAAYAEVQNVKVSGDITVMGVYRNNFDFTKSPAAGTNAAGAVTTYENNYSDQREYLASITRVRLDADLTDNVSATVRLLNERAWNGDSTQDSSGGNQNINLNVPSASYMDELQIDLDLAYITAKEFLYSPLTLMVGRQELHFGNDFIIGDPDTNGIALRSRLPDGDLSSRKAFDAVRATLDYDPLVVDIIYAKIAEGVEKRNDDTTLTGLNARYGLRADTTLEGYFFAKLRGSKNAAVTNAAGYSFSGKEKPDKVYTIGGRVVNNTLKNLTIDAQAGYQFGDYNPAFDVNANQFAETSHRSAWAAEVIGTYDLKDVKMIGKYSPTFSAIYAAFSGNSRENGGEKSYGGWDPMFENQTLGHIINGTMAFGNAHFVGASLKAKPMDDVTVKLDGVGVWVMKRLTDGRLYSLSGVNGSRSFYMAKNPHIGSEVDVTLTYDYTEDVQLSLLGGVFFPGKAISRSSTAGDDPAGSGTQGRNSGLKSTATEVIGSMKVTF